MRTDDLHYGDRGVTTDDLAWLGFTQADIDEIVDAQREHTERGYGGEYPLDAVIRDIVREGLHARESRHQNTRVLTEEN